MKFCTVRLALLPVITLATVTFAAPGTVSHDAAVDIYRITDDIHIANPPRFGTNIPWVYHMKPWSSLRLLNSWNENFSFEPYVVRHEVKVYTIKPENTPTAIYYPWEQGSYGLSKWGLYPSGLYDGGTIEIYRATSDSFERIHQSKITKYVADREQSRFDNGHVIFEDPIPEKYGAAVKQGDILVFTHKLYGPSITCPHPNSKRRDTGFFTPTRGSNVSWLIDPDTCCPEDGSTTSMRIDVKGSRGRLIGMEHWFINETGPEPTALQFLKDHPYRCQVWLKQEGLSDGKVTIQLGGYITKELDVGDEWEKFEFDVPTKQSTHVPQDNSLLVVGAESDGSIWIDNFLIYQADVEPFGLMPWAEQELKKFKPQQLRVWAGYVYNVMEAALSKDFGGLGEWEDRFDAHTGLSMTKGLQICETVDADPWMPLWALYSEGELNFFMEFLGGPASTPGGALRTAQGHEAPWTDVFEQIILECNNEAWNQPFNIAGSNMDPVMYGKLVNRMFRIIKNSPYYNPDQFILVANGDQTRPYRKSDWQTGGFKPGPEGRDWTFTVLATATEADATDWGVYYGGADGLTVLGENDQELYQNQMLYSKRVAEPNIFNPALELRREFKEELGRDILLGIYEGGPGYPIPNPQIPFTPAGEIMGKSLAMGVLTLDAFMRQQNDNYFSMCFYLLSVGNNWVSHNNMRDVIPNPSWLALNLRNRYCSGDLMTVEDVDVKKLDYPEERVTKLSWDGKREVERIIKATKGVPWTQCYAYRDGKRWSYIIYNLSYDEPRTIRLNLPYKPKPEFTVYSLTHEDPRIHTLEEATVSIEEETRTGFTDGFEMVIPPSSAFVLVSEEQ